MSILCAELDVAEGKIVSLLVFSVVAALRFISAGYNFAGVRILNSGGVSLWFMYQVSRSDVAVSFCSIARSKFVVQCLYN